MNLILGHTDFTRFRGCFFEWETNNFTEVLFYVDTIFICLMDLGNILLVWILMFVPTDVSGTCPCCNSNPLDSSTYHIPNVNGLNMWETWRNHWQNDEIVKQKIDETFWKTWSKIENMDQYQISKHTTKTQSSSISCGFLIEHSRCSGHQKGTLPGIRFFQAPSWSNMTLNVWSWEGSDLTNRNGDW